MCTLVSAKAHEVQIGVEQGFEFQSNVLKTPTNPTRDGTYRLTPTLTFAQPESDLTYDLEYRPTYTGYFRTDGVNGVDHLIRGRGQYQINGRDAVRFDTEFIRVRAIRSNNFVDLTGQPLVVANAQGQNQRFVANLGFDHSFSMRTVGSVTLNYNRWDYIDSNNVDNQGYGATFQLTHALLERLTVGANAEGRYRAFEETSFAPASFSTVVNFNALATIRVTDQLSFQASGGPAGVISRQSVPGPRFVSRWNGVAFDFLNCNPGPCGRLWEIGGSPPPPCGTIGGAPILRSCLISPAAFLTGRLDEQKLITLDPTQTAFGQEQETLTYFLSLTAIQRFRHGSLVFSFVRNEDAGTGIGSTTILNSVSARFAYSLSDYWKLAVTGLYTFRDSVSQFPFTDVSAQASPGATDDFGNPLAEASLLVANTTLSQFQQTIATFDAVLTRQLGERSSLQFRFRYYDQSQDNAASTFSSDFDNYTAGVSFIYEFDPHKF